MLPKAFKSLSLFAIAFSLFFLLELYYQPNLASKVSFEYPAPSLGQALAGLFSSFDVLGGIFGVIGVLLFTFSVPMVIATFELVSIQTQGGDLKNHSFSRLRDSEGFDYADVWYFVVQKFSSKFPLLAFSFTLGISEIYPTLFSYVTSFIPAFTITDFFKPAALIVAVLAEDFSQFFAHKIQHSSRFIWQFHEFHHSATHMTIFSNSRHCRIQELANLVVFPSFALSLFLITDFIKTDSKFLLITYFAYKAYSALHQGLQHSSLLVLYPRCFDFLVMSPALHWIHHSDNTMHYDKNFGVLFPFWDKIFGTYLDRSHLPSVSGFGVDGTDYNKHSPIYSYYILPLRKFFNGILN